MLLGLPFLVWNVWTVAAWLADGPQQYTEFRDRNTTSWYAARVYEGIAVAIAVGVIAYLVKDCRRQRRFLTFDVMFCMVGATVFWTNLVANFIQPLLLNSSNWVNVSDMCGHMPLVVNPDCGRAPQPFLFLFLVETFGLLPAAKAATAAVNWLRTRRPGISTAKLVGLVALSGLVAALVFEVPVVALGLWTFAPGPLSIPLGEGLRLPLAEVAIASSFFALMLIVYVFTNDKGQRLVERGTEHYGPRLRTGITLLALYGYLQFVMWGPAFFPIAAYSFFQSDWDHVPPHLLNDLCDAPGVQGTRYGPCPGSPDFHMPGRHSLPGDSP